MAEQGAKSSESDLETLVTSEEPIENTLALHFIKYVMRYYYKPPKLYFSQYGETYACNHPIYTTCTLYKISSSGLAVIQQRFNPKNKTTYWTEIDACLVDDLYLASGFLDFFKKHAKGPDDNGLYPTVTVRQIMWKLRFKPLKREVWETVFDKIPIM